MKKIIGCMMICGMFIPAVVNGKAKAEDFHIYSDKTDKAIINTKSLGKYKNYTIKKDKTVGTYPKRSGVILVTSTGSIAKIVGHAAIVYSASNVIESLEKGVCIGANNWSSSKSTVAAATVTYATKSQDKNVAMWCKKQVGKKYNFNYYNPDTRDKFYCSQLVWAGFKDVYGINLNTGVYDIAKKKAIGPYEFIRKKSDKLFLIYMKNWTKKDVTL